MRLNGSAEGCEAAARQLQRAAAEAFRTAEALQRAEAADWTGTAARGWERLASERVRRLREVAHALSAASRAVAQHADVLRELQARSRRLTSEAAEAGLHLGEDGWIGPVTLPEPAAPEAVREALHRREVRRRVLSAVAQVRAEEDRMHGRLLVELARADEVPLPERDCDWGLGDRLRSWWDGATDDGADWRPGRSDLPATAVSVSQAAASVTERLPSVLRSASASSGLGFVVGVPVDVIVNDHDLDDALTKNAVVTGTAFAAGAAIAVSAPAWLAVAGAAVVGYGTGRAFDAFGHLLPWVQHSSERRASRRTGAPQGAPATRHPLLPPTPDGTVPRHVVHRLPAPAPGPAPGRP